MLNAIKTKKAKRMLKISAIEFILKNKSLTSKCVERINNLIDNLYIVLDLRIKQVNIKIFELEFYNDIITGLNMLLEGTEKSLVDFDNSNTINNIKQLIDMI